LKNLSLQDFKATYLQVYLVSFQENLRVFADVLAGPRFLIACRWKSCGEGEILFVLAENVSFAL